MSVFQSFGKAAAGIALAGGMMTAAIPAFAQEYTAENPLKVALVVHGSLGDKSFFDSAAAGLQRADADLPVELSASCRDECGAGQRRFASRNRPLRRSDSRRI